jgi:hypothetical protein
MPSRTTGEAPGRGIGLEQMLQFGKEHSEAMIQVQTEFLDAYQEASKAWVERVQSEVKFWSDLSGKLGGARSISEKMEICSDGASHRLQMAAEDGRRFFEHGQKMIAAITASLANGSAKTT